MPEIRPFERRDLPEVVNLLGGYLEGWDGDVDLIEAAFLDHPWVDPDTPSLVLVDDGGKPTGFLGVHPRRIEFEGARLQAACCTHMVVHPDHRAGGGAAQLVRQVMSGPQELTWSDTTVPVVARMWSVFGGRVDYGRAADWLIVLRPLRWGARALGDRARGHPRTDELPVAGVPIHVVRRLMPKAYQPTSPEVSGADATVAEIVAEQPEVTRRLALYVPYDEAALDFTLAQFEAAGKPVVRRVVRHGGRPIGWYVYLLNRGGVSRVIHLAAAAREAEHVLGELLGHARDAGTAAVSGRYEPHLDAALRSRVPILGLNSVPAIRARNPKVSLTLAGASSLLTHLDGEWNPR